MKIVMKRDKECKGSVRFATKDDDAIVSNVYVSRGFIRSDTAVITVTVEIGDTTKPQSETDYIKEATQATTT